jgi:PKD repeat protein
VLAGQAATFTVSFSSTSTLTYTWDFGDGIVAAGGSTNWRIYTSPGSYLLKVTATDTAGQSATASAIITVVVAGSAGPTAADSDGDGSADADELAVGTNPHDPNSKPGGSADCDGDGLTDDKDPDADGDGVSTANEIAMGTDPFNAASFVKLPMTVAKLQAKAVFGVTGRDSITVAGVIPGLAAGLDPAGQQAVLKVRGVTAPFTLGPTGRAKSSQGSFQLKLKGKRDRTTKRLVFIGGNAPFTAVLKGGTFADLLGMDQAADASAQAASIAVDVQVFGYVFTDAPNALYSAKAGKGGKFKK